MELKDLKTKLENVEKNTKNAEAIYYQLVGAENLLKELILEEEKNSKKEVTK